MQRSNEGLVWTPFGQVPASCVIEIDAGVIVSHTRDGHLVLRDKASELIVRDCGEIPREALEIRDPYAYASRLREAHPQGRGGSGLASAYPGYTVVAPAGNIKAFVTTWTVPEFPAEPDPKVTFFLWNGLAGGALQPVLQWGNGSAHYQIANWAFVGGKYVHGLYMPVEPGAVLTGVVLYNSQFEGEWRYTEIFLGYPQADISVGRPDEASGVIECFESYTTDMARIPGNIFTAMKWINLRERSGPQTQKLDWKVTGGTPLPTPSGKNTVIVSDSALDGEIDFYFH